LNKANQSFEDIKKIRAQNYQDALEKVKADIRISRTGQNAGRLYIKNTTTGILEPTKITTVGVKQELTKTLKEFNPKILSKTENNQISELKNLINEWDDITPLGLNDLKRALRNRINIGNSKELNAIITRVENNLRNYVNTRAPQIGEMNRNYAEASEFINKLQKELFGTTSRLSDSTKLNRLLSAFNQKSDVRTKLIEELGEKTGQDLLNEIAGAAMSSWLPTGWVQRFVLGGVGGGAAVSSGIGLPLVAGVAGASPRIVGKATRVLGQASRLTPVINKYGQPIINKLLNQ